MNFPRTCPRLADKASLLLTELCRPAKFLATERSEEVYRETFRDIISILKEKGRLTEDFLASFRGGVV